MGADSLAKANGERAKRQQRSLRLFKMSAPAMANNANGLFDNKVNYSLSLFLTYYYELWISVLLCVCRDGFDLSLVDMRQKTIEMTPFPNVAERTSCRVLRSNGSGAGSLLRFVSK